MEIEEREPHAKRGRGNTGDALTSSMAGFRQGAGHRQGVAHFRTSTGSRDKGQSAAAKFDYINREGKYEKGRDELGYTESGNLPEWAKERPREYWEAADKYERDNGRLFVHAEFALPRELTEQQQIALVQAQAQAMARTKDGKPLPYSFAIHSPKGRNPHFHIEISERALDGKERTPETWFKRAPIGAKKTTDLQPRDWVFETRVAWCDLANRHLEREGINTRLDPRTLKAQGIDRIPEIRVGYTDPKRPHIRKERQERNEAIKLANRLPEAQRDIAKADAQIAELTAILRDIEAREKAAALVKTQEQQPEMPRQVHDQVQQIHAPKKPVQAQEPKQFGTLTQAEREIIDRKHYPALAEWFTEMKAKAERPAPTFETVLAKHPDMVKAKAEAQAAKERSDKAAQAVRDQEWDIESKKCTLGAEEHYHKAQVKAVGILDFARKKELKAEAEKLEQSMAKLIEGAKKLEALRAEAGQLKNAEIQARQEPVNVHRRELATNSDTYKQLAQEQDTHKRETGQAQMWVEKYSPYMTERARREAAKAQERLATAKTQAPQPKAVETPKPAQLTPEEKMLAEKARLLAVAEAARKAGPGQFKERMEAEQQAKKIEAAYVRTLSPKELTDYRRRQGKSKGLGM